MRFFRIVLALVGVVLAARSFGAPASGTRLHYVVLSAKTDKQPPFASVDFVYGPEEKIGGRKFQWWQVEISGRTNVPSCIVRCLTSGDPLDGTRRELQFARYELQVPETGETLEYVDKHTGRALLPAWENFEKYFIPRAAPAGRRANGPPETGEFLGHILSLKSLQAGDWREWPDVKRLALDREMQIGTGRNFKDKEGHRLPQTPAPQEYTYVDFTAEDYRTMIDAGMNLFTIMPAQERFVRDEPVFYYCADYINPPLHYPLDLYRANYLGAGMFMDEPASVLTWDKSTSGLLSHFSDVAAVIEARSRSMYESDDIWYGRHGLEKQLADAGVNFGELRLGQVELPVWETQYDRTYYLMKGGGCGIVHEGRYQLGEFNQQVARFTGKESRFTTRQMLQYYYACLRGGTRPFGKDWGTSIYGQCDPKIAPEAFALAYDMGARYFWFWSSDHGHHVPWLEQLELTRQLTQYARQHPRLSIFAPPKKIDTAITIPNGYFLTFKDLGWLNGFDSMGKGCESQHYQLLMRKTLEAVDDCLRRGRDFDITVDDGHRIEGYRRIVKIRE